MTADQVREIVLQHGRLPNAPQDLEPSADLYALGLTSLTTVHLMLALEDHFDVEFPDHMLSRETFASVEAIAECIEELTE